MIVVDLSLLVAARVDLTLEDIYHAHDLAYLCAHLSAIGKANVAVPELGRHLLLHEFDTIINEFNFFRSLQQEVDRVIVPALLTDLTG